MFLHAVKAMKESHVWSLCLACTVFMGSMFCFVQLWVPVVRSSNPDVPVPVGIIFSSFMASMMVGSTVYGVVNARYHVSSIAMVAWSLAVGGLAFAVCGVFMYQDVRVVVACFLLFEGSVGAHFAR